MLRYIIAVLTLLVAPAWAQSLHWVDQQLGLIHRLMDGRVWTPYVISEDRANGTFTLSKSVDGAYVTIDTSKDLAALKAEGIAAAGQP